MIYEDEHGKQFITSQIAARGEFWWNPKRPHEPSLWESKIYLGEAFFNETISHPVPIDMNSKSDERVDKIHGTKNGIKKPQKRGGADAPFGNGQT